MPGCWTVFAGATGRTGGPDPEILSVFTGETSRNSRVPDHNAPQILLF